jgi:hypothetical protein
VYFGLANSWGNDIDTDDTSSDSTGSDLSMFKAYVNKRIMSVQPSNDNDDGLGQLEENLSDAGKEKELQDLNLNAIEFPTEEIQDEPQTTTRGKVRFNDEVLDENSYPISGHKRGGPEYKEFDTEDPPTNLAAQRPPSGPSETSTLNLENGRVQASVQHSRLRSFVDECIPWDSTSNMFQHVAPFVKVRYVALHSPLPQLLTSPVLWRRRPRK